MSPAKLWSQFDLRTRRQVLVWTSLPALCALAVAVASWAHPPFASFVGECLLTVFGIVITPVIFEVVLGVAGTILVIVIGVLRFRLERSEWEVAGATGGGADAAAIVGGAETDQIALAVAEGHIDLGQPEEAWDALMRVPRPEWDAPATVAVRLRYCTMTRRWREGGTLSEMLKGVGDGAYSEAVARHQIAHAGDLLLNSDSGEIGNASARRGEIQSLLDDAATLWPGAEEVVASDRHLKGFGKRAGSG